MLIYRFGRLLTIKQKTIPLLNEEEQEEILLSYLYQFYQKNLTPQFLYLPQKIENQELLTEQFAFALNVPSRGQKNIENENFTTSPAKRPANLAK